jgi:hypothetical protein
LFGFNIGFNQFIKGNFKKKNNDRLECSQRYFRDWEYCKKKKKKEEETPSSHGKEELLVTIVGSARMRSAPLSARRGEKETNKKIK